MGPQGPTVARMISSFVLLLQGIRVRDSLPSVYNPLACRGGSTHGAPVLSQQLWLFHGALSATPAVFSPLSSPAYTLIPILPLEELLSSLTVPPKQAAEALSLPPAEASGMGKAFSFLLLFSSASLLLSSRLSRLSSLLSVCSVGVMPNRVKCGKDSGDVLHIVILLENAAGLGDPSRGPLTNLGSY